MNKDFISTTSFKFNLEILKKETELLLSNPLYREEEQICFTGRSPDDHFLTGTGSLFYKFHDNDKKRGGGLERVESLEGLEETDFKFFLKEFKNTYFYSIYQEISKEFNIGRVRAMTLKPKSCYTFHVDLYPRLHLALLSDSNICGLIHDEKVFRIPVDGRVYLVDTTLEHTAFNSSFDFFRTHLILDILPKV